jgi:hypothetical protein
VQIERTLTNGDALRIASLITVMVVVVSGSAQAVVDTGDFDSVYPELSDANPLRLPAKRPPKISAARVYLRPERSWKLPNAWPRPCA